MLVKSHFLSNFQSKTKTCHHLKFLSSSSGQTKATLCKECKVMHPPTSIHFMTTKTMHSPTPDQTLTGTQSQRWTLMSLGTLVENKSLGHNQNHRGLGLERKILVMACDYES